MMVENCRYFGYFDKGGLRADIREGDLVRELMAFLLINLTGNIFDKKNSKYSLEL